MRARAFAASEGAGSPRGLGRGEMALTTASAPSTTLATSSVLVASPFTRPHARVGGLDGGGVADHAGDLMAAAQGFLRDAPADVPGSADDDDLHGTYSRLIGCGRLSGGYLPVRWSTWLRNRQAEGRVPRAGTMAPTCRAEEGSTHGGGDHYRSRSLSPIARRIACPRGSRRNGAITGSFTKL